MSLINFLLDNLIFLIFYFPPCSRQINYTNVIYVPRQYSSLQDAINHISANSVANNLNGLSLVSCGANNMLVFISMDLLRV